MYVFKRIDGAKVEAKRQFRKEIKYFRNKSVEAFHLILSSKCYDVHTWKSDDKGKSLLIEWP